MTTLSIDIAKWIEDGISLLPAGEIDSSGFHISECIPPIFDAYCKLFHPFEVNPDEGVLLQIPNNSTQKHGLTQSDILKKT